MNILDENVPEDQRQLLQVKRIPVKQIGVDIGRKGMKDDEVVPLLHSLDRATFFTLDADFYHPRLRHQKYCLVHLEVERTSVAEYVRRVLRHRSLNTKAKRMGHVVHVEPYGISLWCLGEESERRLTWD